MFNLLGTLKYSNLTNLTEMIWHIDPETETLETNQFWKLAFRIIETFKSWKWPIGRPPNVSNDCDQSNKLMKIVKPLMYESNHARIDNQTIKAKHAKQLSIWRPLRPNPKSAPWQIVEPLMYKLNQARINNQP